MKKSLLFIIAICCFTNAIYAQVTAKDCTAAVNVCTNNSFSVAPAGAGFVDFTTSSNVSNPVNNPAGIVPPGGSGCLKSGELNPTWMIINVQTPGTLEFSMGAGTGVGAQSGCYDWILWPYNASTCSGINANTQAPVRCCWNNHCSGGTGLASAANLPAGGFADDYGAPINANCGDKFILCFSNFSSVNTLVPLNFFGTAVVSCSPLSNTLSINSPSICPGAIATLSVPSSPGTTYTWQPGNVNGNTMTVSPVSTTIYTLNATNACGTLSGTTAVVVSPAMNISFANTNGNCALATLGSSTVTVTGGIGTLNYAWSPLGGSASTASGLTTNIYSVTVTDGLGCTATNTTSIFAPAPLTFSLNTASGGTILACNPSTITLNAINTSTLTNVTYTWNPGNFNGSSITINTPGVYTVTGQDLTVGSCVAIQTIAISQNTAVPTITVTPLSRTITCNGAPATFTASSTVNPNIVGQWLVPPGIPFSPLSGSPLLGSFTSPGTYTASFTDLTTGCSNTQTVSVSSSTAVPSITITANLGYTITCAVPCVSLAITGSAGPAPISYSWTNVTTNATVTPANGGYSVCVPGSYIAGYKDGNNCIVTQTVNVMIDTARIFPTAITNLPSNGFTLTCSNPTLNATAISSPMMAANSYSWITPPNLVLNNDQVIVGLSNIVSTSSPTNYTVMVKGPNGCVGRQKVSFYKNTFVPPYQAVFTPSAITCANSCVFFSPLATPASTIPVTYTFTSPAPTMTSANIPGAQFCTPGTYTMTYQSSINGCTSTTTAIVPTNVAPPATVALTPKQIPCGQTTTIITAGTATTSTTYSYTWAGPAGSGMSAPNGYSTSVNMPGTYFVTIYNTVNGCRSFNSIEVTAGSLDVNMAPDPASGYSPLPVTFNNNTPYTSASGTLTTMWSYGNGIVTTNTALASSFSSVTPYPYNPGSTIYQTAGSYTVLLMITQTVGTVSCVGTATAVVNVELPSDLTVPNVFTPNGDGVNDNFTLLTTNIKEIKCSIFDRWGVKVYDVTSDKGNISWDGKNFGGKEVPAGTYFYILTAEGKDAKTEWTDNDGKIIKTNGTISLFR